MYNIQYAVCSPEGKHLGSQLAFQQVFQRSDFTFFPHSHENTVLEVTLLLCWESYDTLS